MDNARLVSEAGLFKRLIRPVKPETREFQVRVTSVVQIRACFSSENLSAL